MTSYLQGERSVCPKPIIPFFWFTSIGFRSGPSWLVYRLLQDQLYEEAMCKGSTETDSFTQQKQYHKRITLRTMKIPLQSIHSKEGPHYQFSEAQESCQLISDKCHIWHGYVENPAAKYSQQGRSTLSPRSEARGGCQKTSDNQPIHEFGYPLVIPYPGCTAQLG